MGLDYYKNFLDENLLHVFMEAEDGYSIFHLPIELKKVKWSCNVHSQFLYITDLQYTTKSGTQHN